MYNAKARVVSNEVGVSGQEDWIILKGSFTLLLLLSFLNAMESF